jgi:hypothetical protein
MGLEFHRYSTSQICTLTETEEVGEDSEQTEVQWTKQMPVAEKPQMERILDKRINKRTRRKEYF